MRYVLLDDLPHQKRAVVRLSGPDTRRFVQGTITANVEGLAGQTAVAGGLCTVKGKLVTELVVLPVDDTTLDLLVPADTADAVAQSLDDHIIMDDVEVTPPRSVAVGLAWEDGEGAAAPAVSGEGVDTFEARHPGPGRLVVGEAAAVAAALSAGQAVDADGWSRRRIDTATPAWGHEIAADTFPPEVGFVYAVSYDKGCFMGQEPLARIHARGQVNRVMVRVKASAVPEGEPAALTDDGGTEVGTWTTWAKADDGALGLAVVRRKVAAPGHALKSGGIEVEVLTAPLGDDPGVGTKKRTATVKLGGRR